MVSLPKIQKASVADQVFDLLKGYISEGKVKEEKSCLRKTSCAPCLVSAVLL